MKFKVDILIIGAGVAGLSTAISLSEKYPNRKISILLKENISLSATNFAQGGIASSLPNKDSIEKHIKDTLVAGNYKNKKEVVDFVINNSYKAIEFLEKNNINFEESLLLEGGHSEKRIYHYKDYTGKEIQRKLIKEVENNLNINFIVGKKIIDIVSKDNVCYGIKVYSKDKNVVEELYSNHTILSTGGLGQMYSKTTNPLPCNGEGISIAIKNKVKANGVDLVQFHPTALYTEKQEDRNFLISEAVRGEGAFLENIEGERFMKNYNKKGELAPRDVVSLSVIKEMKKTNSKYVYLNILGIKNFNERFPNINSKIKDLGIKEKIPVVPTAHYLCGGINVDLNSETSMKNLYAVGECTNTGLHGSNRLASNSLLEAVVFAMNINLNENINGSFSDSKKIYLEENIDENFAELKIGLKSIMQENMNVEKSTISIITAKNKIENLKKELYKLNSKTSEFLELDNMIILAEQMIRESSNRKENTGVFYNKDLK